MAVISRESPYASQVDVEPNDRTFICLVFARQRPLQLSSNVSLQFAQSEDVRSCPSISDLPSTNILATKFLSEDGVGQIDDYMPLPASKSDQNFLPWLVRHVTVIRGTLTFTMECAPAFDYARAGHETKLKSDTWAEFTCPEHIDLDLRCIPTSTAYAKKHTTPPEITFDTLDLSERGHKGLGVTASFTLREGQSLSFVLREPPKPRTSGEAAVTNCG